MRPSWIVSCGVVLAGMALGCAQPDTAPQAESSSYSAPVRRTGSNIPVARESSQPARELSNSERRLLEDELERPRGGGGGGG